MSPLVQSVLASAMSPVRPPLPAGTQSASPASKPDCSLLTPVLPQTGVIVLERRRAGL